MKLRFLSAFAATLGAVCLMPSAAFAANYSVYDLGVSGVQDGVQNLRSLGGINNAGQIVGNVLGYSFYTGSNGVGINQLLGISGAAYGINDAGQIVGVNFTNDAVITGPHGVGITRLIPDAAWEVHNNDGFSDASYPASDARGINNAGQVVGTTYTIVDTFGAGTFTADYKYYITGPNGTGMNNLGPAEYLDQIDGINDKVQLVGTIGGKAFITEPNGANLQFFSTSGAAGALGINNFGQAVGWFSVTGGASLTDINQFDNGNYHAFITDKNGAGIIDLNTLVTLADGGVLIEATGINDKGQIAAVDNLGHAYLLSAVPEPESYALMLAGLGLIGAAALRKKS